MRFVYAILLAAMIVGGFQPFFLRIFFSDRAAIARRLVESPDRPGYVAFLGAVRRRTPEGSRIAILVPMRHWGRGYSYAYYRASYFLTAREVIPVVDPDDSAHLERVGEADFVASWGMAPRIGGFADVWNGDGGVLLERQGR